MRKKILNKLLLRTIFLNKKNIYLNKKNIFFIFLIIINIYINNN